MKITLVTVCYNSEKTINNTIKSIILQNFTDFEYIIIDGNSNDNTLNIIKNALSGFKHKLISEPDNGIYDAMNKGINMASGDIIGFLNSDDIYINNNVLTEISNAFKNENIDALYADLYYVNRDNTDKIIRKWSTGKYIYGSFRKGWHPAHPTFFVKKEIYQKYGGFNLKFKLAADFELMLRFLEKHKISHTYLPKPIIKMRLGGATSKNLKNILHQNRECILAFKENNFSPPILYPFLRLLPKLGQFFKK